MEEFTASDHRYIVFSVDEPRRLQATDQNEPDEDSQQHLKRWAFKKLKGVSHAIPQ